MEIAHYGQEGNFKAFLAPGASPTFLVGSTTDIARLFAAMGAFAFLLQLLWRNAVPSLPELGIAAAAFYLTALLSLRLMGRMNRLARQEHLAGILLALLPLLVLILL